MVKKAKVKSKSTKSPVVSNNPHNLAKSDNFTWREYILVIVLVVFFGYGLISFILNIMSMFSGGPK